MTAPAVSAKKLECAEAFEAVNRMLDRWNDDHCGTRCPIDPPETEETLP